MVNVSRRRWLAFVASLELDKSVEFGEGDIGIPGGIQITEPASANITTVDMIKRFGGSTSPAAQWPEEELGKDEGDRFELLEKFIERAAKRASSNRNSGQRVNSSLKSASSGTGE